MNYYEKIIYQFAKRYQRKKRYPAVVVCARLSNEVRIDKSGAIPNPLAQPLEVRLSLIGEIGSRVNGNFVGRCAEVRASNPILMNHPTNNPSQITFTTAYRPRTMQIMAPCQNCNNTF